MFQPCAWEHGLCNIRLVNYFRSWYCSEILGVGVACIPSFISEPNMLWAVRLPKIPISHYSRWNYTGKRDLKAKTAIDGSVNQKASAQPSSKSLAPWLRHSRHNLNFFLVFVQPTLAVQGLMQQLSWKQGVPSLVFDPMLYFPSMDSKVDSTLLCCLCQTGID